MTQFSPRRAPDSTPSQVSTQLWEPGSAVKVPSVSV